MKITRYEIVSAPDTVSLQLRVREMIDKGFQPFGGVFVFTPSEQPKNLSTLGDRCFQAMVTYQEPEEPQSDSKLEFWGSDGPM